MTKKPAGPKTEEKPSERSDDKVTPLRAARPCPECGKPSTRQSFPFCSERCRSVDLNRWLSGVYVERLFGPEEEEEDDPGASG